VRATYYIRVSLSTLSVYLMYLRNATSLFHAVIRKPDEETRGRIGEGLETEKRGMERKRVEREGLKVFDVA
jgi:hypothetical protein